MKGRLVVGTFCICLGYLGAASNPADAVDGFGAATISTDGMQASINAEGSTATAAAAVPAAGYAGAVVDPTLIDGAVWQATGSSAASQAGCGTQGGSVQSPGGAPAGTSQYVLVTPDGAVLGTVAVSCTPGPGGAALQPPPPPPTANQVWQSATAWEPLVNSGIKVNPGTTGLTGLSSWFWLSSATTALPPLTLSVAGYTITAAASIQSYSWTFGDGDEALAYSPGSPENPAASHTYQMMGIDQVSVVAHYVGSYTITGHGLAPQTQPLQVSVTMGTLAYPIQEARSVLVPTESVR